MRMYSGSPGSARIQYETPKGPEASICRVARMSNVVATLPPSIVTARRGARKPARAAAAGLDADVQTLNPQHTGPNNEAAGEYSRMSSAANTTLVYCHTRCHQNSLNSAIYD